MKWRALVATAVFAVVAVPAVAHASSPTSSDGIKAALNNALRYNLTVWPEAGAPIRPADLRPDGSIVYAAAVALTTGAYTGNTTELRARAVELTAQLADSHHANGGTWGNSWVSAYTAWLVGTAGTLLHADLPAIGRMLTSEADYQLGRKHLRYYADRSGRILSPGNSGAEENAWDHLVVDLAARTLPNAAHAAGWRTRATLLQGAALIRPVDLPGRPQFDGWNIRNDGTLTNHHVKISPHYMAAALAFDDARSTDAKVVYRALVRYYRADGTVASPYGDDWGLAPSVWIAADATAGTASWLRVHVTRLLGMQARFTDGRTFKAGENKYPGREQVVAADLADALTKR